MTSIDIDRAKAKMIDLATKIPIAPKITGRRPLISASFP